MDQNLRQNVRTLTTWLGQIIQENEGPAFFNQIERVRLLCKDIRASGHDSKTADLHRILTRLSLQDAHVLARAFTLYFQMVNLAEDQHRIKKVLDYEVDPDNPRPMSIQDLFRTLHEKRVSAKEIRHILSQLQVEPVLTAHPTEAKRRTVLGHINRLRNILGALGHSQLSWRDKSRYQEGVLETLEMLWQTKQVRDRRLLVEDEIKHTISFFPHTIFDAVDDLHDAIRRSLAMYYPGVDFDSPLLTFSSWVGGDRDGNPNVTPEISRLALQQHRDLILQHYQRVLNDLFHLVTSAKRFENVDPHLQLSVSQDLRALPVLKKKNKVGEPGEFYRLKFQGLWQRLDNTIKDKKHGYTAVADFADDLKLIQKSLEGHHGHRTARGSIQRLIDQINVYGFHLAQLDFRQHAERIRAAVHELVGFIPSSSEWSALIQNPKSRMRSVSGPTQEILKEFETQRQLQEKFGAKSCDHYIISMTQNENDVWASFYLARLADLLTVEKGEWKLLVDIVPLFETVADLREAPKVMRRLWSDPFYRQLLESRGGVQEIMLGYSDSNKSGGYVSANYELYRVQRRLAHEARAARVKIRFFHGKGGSIDRGGGPSHRAIMAAPDSVTDFKLRITEQGEVISHKYAHPVIAHRNFEQMIHAVVMSNLSSPAKNMRESDHALFEATLGEIADYSMAHYQNLVYKNPNFQTYFMEATPIDLIERIQIASRPVARKETLSISSIRAIPWVFSWTQNRHLLSAWYGMGSGFEAYLKRNPKKGMALLQRMYKRWPFFASLIDNAQLSLCKTDLTMGRRYADLVKDAAIADEIFGAVQAEYELSVRHVLRISKQKNLLENMPVLKESIELRNPYIDPLNALQVEYLPMWRKTKLSKSKKEEILLVLLMTVNGIAFGMKGTG